MSRTRLVVVVPGWFNRLSWWDPLLERLKQEPGYADADWLVWTYSGIPPTLRPLRSLAHSLSARIHQTWKTADGYDDVVLVGHSLGAPLARQAYLFAAGTEPNVSDSCDWAAAVSRFVLFAGMNRGIDPALNRRRRVANWLVNFTPVVRRTLLRDMTRGSEFITNLRIQWIRYFQRLGSDAPLVVQLLGDRDGLVDRNDSVDVEQFPTAYHTTIPDANHGNLHRLDIAADPDGRYALIRDAFIGAAPARAENRQLSGASTVVFVVHGIRARNSDWPEEVARRIRARTQQDVDVVRPTYGYFSALRFALPTTRKSNLQWLQDTYTEKLAYNPNAEFHFIGHSNGTYLLGESLRQIPGMQFNRVVLAGSVLPATYSWSDRMQRGQVQSLRNDRARDDFPVAVLCSGLRGLGMRDVGTGGFEGFREDMSTKTEVFWYAGGHGAAVDAANLDHLIDFVLADRADPADPAAPPAASTQRSLVDGPDRRYDHMSRWASVVVPAVVLLVAGAFAWWMFLVPFYPDPLQILSEPAERALASQSASLRLGSGAGLLLVLLLILDKF